MNVEDALAARAQDGFQALARLTAAASRLPQRVWPRTRISLAPATLQAYSTLPITFRLVMFPATRTLNMSPTPRSKSNSAGVRELMQLTTTARGVGRLSWQSPGS